MAKEVSDNMTFQEKIDNILGVLLEYTMMDFSREIPFSDERDELDAIAVGINSVGQELNHTLDELRRKNRELEKQQKVMERRNRELEQMAYITAHDLREPLVLVSSFCEKLKVDYEKSLDDTADLYINYIHDAAGRMNRLVDGMLHYNQIGKKNQIETIDLNKVIRKILKENDDYIRDKKAVVEVDELPSIMADPEEVEWLFYHLLCNACKFQRPGVEPKVKLSVESFKDSWQFCISDNGMGIEERYHEKIFHIFRQLHPKDQFSGLGLGLPTSRKIVEELQGEIWLESTPGEGSRFYFTIPKHETGQTT